MPGSGSGGGAGGGGNMMGTAVGAYNIIAGNVNKAKANEEARLLEANRPIKTTSQFDRDSFALAQSELANGMSAEAEQAYNDATDRSLASSVSAILKAGGSVNNIGDVYGATADGRQKLAILQEQMRLQRVQQLIAESNKMSNEDEKNWLVNKYGPYMNKMQAIGDAKKAAAAQTAKGIDTLASSMGGMSLGGGSGSGGTGGGNYMEHISGVYSGFGDGEHMGGMGSHGG